MVPIETLIGFSGVPTRSHGFSRFSTGYHGIQTNAFCKGH